MRVCIFFIFQEVYRENPAVHPQYEEEQMQYITSLQNSSNYGADFDEDAWGIYWNDKLHKLCNEEMIREQQRIVAENGFENIKSFKDCLEKNGIQSSFPIYLESLAPKRNTNANPTPPRKLFSNDAQFKNEEKNKHFERTARNKTSAGPYAEDRTSKRNQGRERNEDRSWKRGAEKDSSNYRERQQSSVDGANNRYLNAVKPFCVKNNFSDNQAGRGMSNDRDKRDVGPRPLMDIGELELRNPSGSQDKSQKKKSQHSPKKAAHQKQKQNFQEKQKAFERGGKKKPQWEADLEKQEREFQKQKQHNQWQVHQTGGLAAPCDAQYHARGRHDQQPFTPSTQAMQQWGGNTAYGSNDKSYNGSNAAMAAYQTTPATACNSAGLNANFGQNQNAGLSANFGQNQSGNRGDNYVSFNRNQNANVGAYPSVTWQSAPTASTQNYSQTSGNYARGQNQELVANASIQNYNQTSVSYARGSHQQPVASASSHNYSQASGNYARGPNQELVANASAQNYNQTSVNFARGSNQQSVASASSQYYNETRSREKPVDIISVLECLHNQQGICSDIESSINRLFVDAGNALVEDKNPLQIFEAPGHLLTLNQVHNRLKQHASTNETVRALEKAVASLLEMIKKDIFKDIDIFSLASNVYGMSADVMKRVIDDCLHLKFKDENLRSRMSLKVKLCVKEMHQQMAKR